MLIAAWMAFSPLAATAATDYGFIIQHAELHAFDNGKLYLLDADIDFRFSEPAIEALRNGVCLSLVLAVKLKPENEWWFEKALLDDKISFRICYHALSKLYQIIYENTEPPINFVSFNALLESMGSIREYPVVLASQLSQGERYRASLSVGLDIESLPLPLRPVAYVTPAWHLKSPQYKWTFVK